MIRKVKREKFPIKGNIFDSNYNSGIIIGNTIIFNGKTKEIKKIKAIYQHNNDTHGFYVEFKGENKLKIIYLREN